jgi:hypothetical protein
MMLSARPDFNKVGFTLMARQTQRKQASVADVGAWIEEGFKPGRSDAYALTIRGR